MKAILTKNSTWVLLIFNLLSFCLYANENSTWDINQILAQQDSLTTFITKYDNKVNAATFPGGDEELLHFLAKNFQFKAMKAEETKKGYTIVKLHLNKHGKVVKTEFISSVHPLISKEIKRVVKKMPNWIPATENGMEIPSFVLMPIHTH